MTFKPGDKIRTNAHWNPVKSSEGVVKSVEGNYINAHWPQGIVCTGRTEQMFRDAGAIDFSFSLSSAKVYVEEVIEVDETEGKKVVNVSDLRSYAIRGSVERDRVYLYVYAGQGSVSVITARTPLVLRSAEQTHGYSYDGADEQMWKFRSERPSRYAKDGVFTDWHHATDAGVIVDRRRNGNFMLDPADLFAEGIVAEARGTKFTPSEVAKELSV